MNLSPVGSVWKRTCWSETSAASRTSQLNTHTHTESELVLGVCVCVCRQTLVRGEEGERKEG